MVLRCCPWNWSELRCCINRHVTATMLCIMKVLALTYHEAAGPSYHITLTPPPCHPAPLQAAHEILAGKCIRPDGSRALVLDVGANFGYFALYAGGWLQLRLAAVAGLCCRRLPGARQLCGGTWPDTAQATCAVCRGGGARSWHGACSQSCRHGCAGVRFGGQAVATPCAAAGQLCRCCHIVHLPPGV